MQIASSPSSRDPSQVLIATLRASLAAAGSKMPGRTARGGEAPAYVPLNNDELRALADVWRLRRLDGDLGAEMVSGTLEALAEARANAPIPRSRLREMAYRISGLMQLN